MVSNGLERKIGKSKNGLFRNSCELLEILWKQIFPNSFNEGIYAYSENFREEYQIPFLSITLRNKPS